MPAPDLAARLLDAQVSWLLARLDGADLGTTIAADVDDLLALGSRTRLDALVDAKAVKEIAHLLVEKVPPSTAASTLVAAAADVLYDGPTQRFTLSDLIERDHVESLATEVLGMTDLVEQVLDQLTESPLVAATASRFVGRIVNDVVQMNQAVADKIPGVGSLMSFGTKAAGSVLGAADKGLQQVLGDTAGKGATFAMRRLNKIVVEILQDPATKDAVLEVFDLYADQPIPHLNQVAEREDVHRVADLLQDMVIAGAPTDAVLELVDALIDGFFTTYGEHPPTTLLDELGITRDDLVRHATAVVPGLLATARETGELEGLIRARLEPFWASPEVAAILAE